MLWTSLKAVGPADLLDIALVAVLLYALLVWFKRARAAVMAKGMLVLAAVYMLSRVTGMKMTTSIFQWFFAILLVALVVIFQEELRSVFERIAIWSLSGGSMPAQADEETETLIRTLADLKRDRIGALVVLRGKDPLDRHLEGGWALGGELSEALVKSIFDVHSIGHDGAMVVEGGKITRFGCRLPLSKEFGKTARYGTRHAAALGLGELTDALCVVLSEERGTISVAQDGRLESVADLEALEKRVSRFSTEKRPRPAKETVRTFLRKNSREKAVAVSASFLLWALFVLGGKSARHTFDVAVRPRNVPETMSVSNVKPRSVKVTVTAQMKDFYRFGSRLVTVRLDMARGRPGANRMPVGEVDIGRPPAFILEEIKPVMVEVKLAKKEPAKKERTWP